MNDAGDQLSPSRAGPCSLTLSLLIKLSRHVARLSRRASCFVRRLADDHADILAHRSPLYSRTGRGQWLRRALAAATVTHCQLTCPGGSSRAPARVASTPHLFGASWTQAQHQIVALYRLCKDEVERMGSMNEAWGAGHTTPSCAVRVRGIRHYRLSSSSGCAFVECGVGRARVASTL